MNLRSQLLLLLVVCLALGCGPDLPPGWEDAESIDDFTQMKCSGSALGDEHATVTAAGVKGGVDVDYGSAHFRCAQEVEGFLRREGDMLDVLVQPEDMDPDQVPLCDCLYDIAMHLPSGSGEKQVTVYRRWDNLNDDNDPVEEGTASVRVP